MYSMTGYGAGQFNDDKYKFKVEIKSINHRYHEVSVRLPRHIQFLEPYIRNEVKSALNRGKIEVNIVIEYLQDSGQEIKVDLSLAQAYLEAYQQIITSLKLQDKVRLNNLLAPGDVISSKMKELDESEIVSVLRPALKEALDNTLAMRLQEGEFIRNELENRIKDITTKLALVEDKAKDAPDLHKIKLEERIRELLGEDVPLDPERLANEVAYYADKVNIEEEINRLRSHNAQFLEIVKEVGPVGRKLDFLVQEMNREINTVGSKSNDEYISKLVIDIKSEIEKIREQIQNIE